MEFETPIVFSSPAFLSLLVQLGFCFMVKAVVIQGLNQNYLMFD